MPKKKLSEKEARARLIQIAKSKKFEITTTDKVIFMKRKKLRNNKPVSIPAWTSFGISKKGIGQWFSIDAFTGEDINIGKVGY